MKSPFNINLKLSCLQNAVEALSNMDITIQSVLITGGKPIIRVNKNYACIRLLEQGKAGYSQVTHDNLGRFCQGVFYVCGCRVIWSESLH